MTPQTMNVAPVGSELRAARIAADLTIEQLAVRAGIGGATVERIEHGRVTPHRATLLALAIALSNDNGRAANASVGTAEAAHARLCDEQ
jgi:transcriptional regulator with XRE-family HTH domain